MQTPKPGDIVYLDTELYVSHGVNDMIGGKAIVKEVVEAPYGDVFITTELDPTAQYKWKGYLEPEQEKLKEEFGDSWAHFEPDMRPEFND